MEEHKRNCSLTYHWGTVQCQDFTGDQRGIAKSIRSRQHICLHCLTFKQSQVGRAAVFSRIRRFRSSFRNLSWVFFLNKPVKTHSWQPCCALYTSVRASVRHSQSFLRICRSHFRKDSHFKGFFLKPLYEVNTKGLPGACYRQYQGQTLICHASNNERAVAVLTAEQQNWVCSHWASIQNLFQGKWMLTFIALFQQERL